MLGSNGSIPAPKVIGGTVLVASPADSFRMLRIKRHFRFRHNLFRLTDSLMSVRRIFSNHGMMLLIRGWDQFQVDLQRQVGLPMVG